MMIIRIFKISPVCRSDTLDGNGLVESVLYIGTTGWDYKHWNGSLYTGQDSDRLSFFSRVSSFTELQSTFSTIPSTEDVQLWHDQTAPSFQFISLMMRKVTNNQQLQVDKATIELYFETMKLLKNKLSMVLLQFPAKLQRTAQTSDFVIGILDTCREHFQGQFLVEAKNRSWHKEIVKKELGERSACLVSTDKRPISSEARDDHVYYLRLMGDKRLVPAKDFGKINLDRTGDLKYWATHLKFLNKKHHQVFVAIDNHFSGNSARDAIILVKELKQIGVEAKGFKVKKSSK
ncbi:MAG: DUF72 domain-containing protein [Candidatus Kariarchaeaceae archaeon]|jgi:uncharacterized protein YecE (DUF72 family)